MITTTLHPEVQPLAAASLAARAEMEDQWDFPAGLFAMSKNGAPFPPSIQADLDMYTVHFGEGWYKTDAELAEESAWQYAYDEYAAFCEANGRHPVRGAQSKVEQRLAVWADVQRAAYAGR